MLYLRNILIYLLVLGNLACATIGELRLTNQKLANLTTRQRKQQEILRKEIEAIKKQIKAIELNIADIRKRTGLSGANLSADLATVRKRVAMLEGKLEELAFNLKGQQQDVQHVKKVLDDRFSLGLTTLPKGFQETPENLIKLAKASYETGKMEDARIAARRFIELYPDMKQAPAMQLLIGESYLKTKQYGLAIRELQKVHDHYQKVKDKAVKEIRFKALEDIVDALLAQNDCKKALALLRYIYRLDRRGPHGRESLRKIKALKGQCK